VTYPEKIEVDVEDDLNREVALYVPPPLVDHPPFLTEFVPTLQLQASPALCASREIARGEAQPAVYAPSGLLCGDGQVRLAHGADPAASTRREGRHRAGGAEAPGAGGEEVREAGAAREAEGAGEGKERDGGEVEGLEEE
jgi:hypothetical protein